MVPHRNRTALFALTLAPRDRTELWSLRLEVFASELSFVVKQTSLTKNRIVFHASSHYSNLLSPVTAKFGSRPFKIP
ncbi:hypothetical protein A0H81_11387 [Grifola frondosa]|uniref:Uncharacterized protein n=1 Tax=Grifola frondosa TaxID=5627 RepID=A0A1C7LX21_GRIFR|nr:hypothetical protein A0H81_11387 [Grifola frondosa]